MQALKVQSDVGATCWVHLITPQGPVQTLVQTKPTSLNFRQV